MCWRALWCWALTVAVGFPVPGAGVSGTQQQQGHLTRLQSSRPMCPSPRESFSFTGKADQPLPTKFSPFPSTTGWSSRSPSADIQPHTTPQQSLQFYTWPRILWKLSSRIKPCFLHISRNKGYDIPACIYEAPSSSHPIPGNYQHGLSNRAGYNSSLLL